MKIITNFETLMQLAYKEGQARMQYGADSEEFRKANAEHDAYKEICLKSDEMTLNRTYEDLL